MTKLQSLNALIASLTKAERRHFKLYSKRIGVETDKKFLLLYEVLISNECKNDKDIRKHIHDSSILRHLPFFKNHLFEMLLEGLLDMYRKDGVKNQLKRWLQQGEQLFFREMYLEAKRNFAKAKALAIRFECYDDLLLINRALLKIIELEATDYDMMYELSKESQYYQNQLRTETELLQLKCLFNMKLREVGKAGIATNRKVFDDIIDDVRKKEANGFIANFILYGLEAAYAFIIETNVQQCNYYDNAQLTLFKNNNHFFELYPIEYVKAVSNTYQSTFGSNIVKQRAKLLNDMAASMKQHKIYSAAFVMPEVARIILNLKFTQYWTERNFKAIIELRAEIEKVYSRDVSRVDELKRQHLLLSVAISYVHLADTDKALDCIASILNERSASFYFDTYFDCLLLRWSVYYKTRKTNGLNSIIHSIQYTSKKYNIVDREVSLLIKTMKHLNHWNLTKYKKDVYINEIKELLSIKGSNDFSRRYLILKYLIA